MTCHRVPLPGGVAIVCTRGSRPARCAVAGCQNTHTKLCDFPLTGAKAGKTCDRRLCDRHACTQGRDVDYCPTHDEIAKAARPTPTKCASCGFHIVDTRSGKRGLCTDCLRDVREAEEPRDDAEKRDST